VVLPGGVIDLIEPAPRARSSRSSTWRRGA